MFYDGRLSKIDVCVSYKNLRLSFMFLQYLTVLIGVYLCAKSIKTTFIHTFYFKYILQKYRNFKLNFINKIKLVGI